MFLLLVGINLQNRFGNRWRFQWNGNMSLALVFSSILPFHHFAISSFHHFMCSLRPAVPGVLLLMNAHLWEEGPKSISFQCMYQCFLNHLASCYLVYNLLLWKLKRHCGLMVSALDCTSSSLWFVLGQHLLLSVPLSCDPGLQLCEFNAGGNPGTD